MLVLLGVQDGVSVWRGLFGADRKIAWVYRGALSASLGGSAVSFVPPVRADAAEIVCRHGGVGARIWADCVEIAGEAGVDGEEGGCEKSAGPRPLHRASAVPLPRAQGHRGGN